MHSFRRLVVTYLDKVFLPGGDTGQTLLHEGPVGVELLRCLQKVAAVGEQGSFAGRNNSEA